MIDKKDSEHSNLSDCDCDNQVAAATDVEMGENSQNDHENKSTHKKKFKEKSPVKESLTNLAHFCVVSYALLIFYLCFTHEFIFFTWHPILLSVGWVLAMSESILSVSKDNALLSRDRGFSHTFKIRAHWILQIVAVTSTLAGFLVVFINKNRLGKDHFKSWHGLLGFLGLCCTLPPCINGIALLYRRDLSKYVKPKIIKFVHVISGCTAFIFGGISLLLSVYTKWFARKTENSLICFVFGFGAIAFPLLWILSRPALMCLRILKKQT